MSKVPRRLRILNIPEQASESVQPDEENLEGPPEIDDLVPKKPPDSTRQIKIIWPNGDVRQIIGEFREISTFTPLHIPRWDNELFLQKHGQMITDVEKAHIEKIDRVYQSCAELTSPDKTNLELHPSNCARHTVGKKAHDGPESKKGHAENSNAAKQGGPEPSYSFIASLSRIK